VQQPYFNSLPLDKFPDEVIIEMIEHSYGAVFGKLPKNVRTEINNG
jgi:predicted DNA-binding protein (MmcQ/YjbR family)